MTHPADFADAHRRHLEDAELLFGNARWANANHLYGLSAECGLKAVMRALGMPVDAGGKPSPKYMRRLPRVWPEFLDFVAGRSDMPAARTFPGGERFGDWSIEDRYAHRRWFQRDNVETHRRAAQGILDMVERALEER